MQAAQPRAGTKAAISLGCRGPEALGWAGDLDDKEEIQTHPVVHFQLSSGCLSCLAHPCAASTRSRLPVAMVVIDYGAGGGGRHHRTTLRVGGAHRQRRWGRRW